MLPVKAGPQSNRETGNWMSYSTVNKRGRTPNRPKATQHANRLSMQTEAGMTLDLFLDTVKKKIK